MSTEKPETIKQEKLEEIQRLKKQLNELEPPCVIPVSKEESEDDEDEILPIEIQKPRKPRSEKQIEQFKKVVETKMKNASVSVL